MPHVELTLPSGHHITVVHIPQPLQREQVDIVCRGLDKIGKRGEEIVLYWSAPEFMGYRKNIPAQLVEDGSGVFTELREELVKGLRFFHIPVSSNRGEYTPHVTKPPVGMIPWTRVEFLPQFTYVHKQLRIPVTFS